VGEEEKGGQKKESPAKKGGRIDPTLETPAFSSPASKRRVCPWGWGEGALPGKGSALKEEFSRGGITGGKKKTEKGTSSTVTHFHPARRKN